MLKLSWKDQVTNAAVLDKVDKKDRLNTIWQRKHRWLGRVLRNEVSLYKTLLKGE